MAPKSILALAALTLAACSPVDAIDAPTLAPGLWERTLAMRVAADDPLIRSDPVTTRFCVGADGRYALPYLQDNGSECRVTSLKKHGVMWEGRSQCDKPGLDPLIITASAIGDFQSGFAIIGVLGPNPTAPIIDVRGRRLGPCPADFKPEPPTDTVYR